MSANKVRYLIFFQYRGTKYSGVVKAPATQAVLGVQNYLELAARKLSPVGNVAFSISSRTDSGVHALCNSAHVDIERAPGKPPFSEDVLVKGLNFHLKPEPISVLKAVRVSDDFHARFNALSRTYLYRVVTGCNYTDMPLFERNLCWAASKRDLQFWDFTFKSKSFAYNQVRRMTSALVAVGLGLLTPQQITVHLETGEPPFFSRNVIAPPSGLFLKEVEYAEIDLKTDKSEPGRCTSVNT